MAAVRHRCNGEKKKTKLNLKRCPKASEEDSKDCPGIRSTSGVVTLLQAMGGWTRKQHSQALQAAGMDSRHKALSWATVAFKEFAQKIRAIRHTV